MTDFSLSIINDEEEIEENVNFVELRFEEQKFELFKFIESIESTNEMTSGQKTQMNFLLQGVRNSLPADISESLFQSLSILNKISNNDYSGILSDVAKFGLSGLTNLGTGEATKEVLKFTKSRLGPFKIARKALAKKNLQNTWKMYEN